MRTRAHIVLGSLLLGCTADALAAPPASPRIIVAEVREDDFVDRVEALGTLKANESVALTATVTDTVSAIHFDDGDRVPEGKVLVEMTSAEEHALLQEARATLGEAKRQYNRMRSLEAQGTAARSLLDERRREWETARARLAAIESRLADRLIKAPFAGVLGLRDLSLGALVEPGDPITTLDDDRVMKLEFPVPSTLLAALRPGLPILATTRAYGERAFRGEVKAIASRVDPVTRSVLVRAAIPNSERLLKPGMLMQVILSHNPRRALVIPEEALVPKGTRQFVLKLDEADGNRVARTEVKVGARRPGEVEILTGLAAGEKVITQGTVKVRPGQQVRIQAVDDGTRPLRELTARQEAAEIQAGTP